MTAPELSRIYTAQSQWPHGPLFRHTQTGACTTIDSRYGPIVNDEDDPRTMIAGNVFQILTESFDRLIRGVSELVKKLL